MVGVSVIGKDGAEECWSIVVPTAGGGGPELRSPIDWVGRTTRCKLDRMLPVSSYLIAGVGVPGCG